MLGRSIRTLLEVRLEAKRPLLVGTIILVFLSISRRVRHRQLLKQWAHCTSRYVKRMWGPLSRKLGGLSLSLESPQFIWSSLNLVRWNMSLHLSGFRKTRPSFESGHLGVHSPWGRKQRVPLTYLFLREGSSFGACGKLAHLFSRRQGIILIPRWYGVHGTFLKLLYWNWWSSILEKVVSENLSRFLKGVKPFVL